MSDPSTYVRPNCSRYNYKTKFRLEYTTLTDMSKFRGACLTKPFVNVALKLLLNSMLIGS
eukprot:SAG31_NODE_1410_length_8470_cov_6.064031_7_plen_60_part_00